MSTVPTTADAVAVPLRLPRSGVLSRILAHRLALPVLFGVSLLYHGLWSLGHRTPLVFDDELLYTKLSQNLAAGRGLEIWGHHYFFPSLLAPLVQAPMWLLFGTGEGGYLAVRLLGAALMASAAFPVWWLASRLIRREWALLTAASAVVLPAMAYHDYLTAEALAYPLFLLGIAAIVRAVADGSRGMRILVPAVCALGVATRLQLVVLPLAYFLAAALCSARRRAHIVPLAALAVPGAAALALRGAGAIGQYDGVLHLSLTPGAVLHWALLVAMLLPFSIGLAVVPGALLGLAARPRNRAEAAFAVVTIVSVGAMLAQAGILAAGEAQRPLERYAFYVAPLLVLSFFLYVERGAPRRLLYAGLALGGGLAVARLPFSALAGQGTLYYDAPTATSFASIAGRFGNPNATLIVELLALAVGIGVALAHPKRASLATGTALAALALSLAGGAAYYRSDHATTAWVVQKLTPPHLVWVDQPATYLTLPGHELIPDSLVEIWNPKLEHVAQFDRSKGGALPIAAASISERGVLQIGGRPNERGRYVLGSFGSRIGLDAGVTGRNGWLTTVELPRAAHVRWLADGWRADGFSAPYLIYRTWPARPGRFELRLSLPNSFETKSIDLSTGEAHRIVTLRPGGRVTLSLPARRGRLRMAVAIPRTTSDSFTRRGVRVERLVYVAG